MNVQLLFICYKGNFFSPISPAERRADKNWCYMCLPVCAPVINSGLASPRRHKELELDRFGGDSNRGMPTACRSCWHKIDPHQVICKNLAFLFGFWRRMIFAEILSLALQLRMLLSLILPLIHVFVQFRAKSYSTPHCCCSCAKNGYAVSSSKTPCASVLTRNEFPCTCASKFASTGPRRQV